MMASPETKPDEMIAMAKALPEVAAAIEGKRVVKEIAVPGRLVNLVAV
jgi:leucyl-tRNA synthetase